MKVVIEKTMCDSLLGNLDEALRSAYNGVAEAISDEEVLNEIRLVKVHIEVSNCTDIPEVCIEINRLPERIHIYKKGETE